MPPKTEKGNGDILKVSIQPRNYAAKTALSVDFMINWSVNHYK